jgi:hypothetical protein
VRTFPSEDWRVRPRERFARTFRADHYVVACGGLWFVSLASLVGVVTGNGPVDRVESLLIALGSAAAAAGMSWLGLLWLRRPVLPEPVSPEEKRRGELMNEGIAAKAKAERRAWRSR